MGSLLERRFQASFTFCQLDRLAMALFMVMLIGLSPSWSEKVNLNPIERIFYLNDTAGNFFCLRKGRSELSTRSHSQLLSEVSGQTEEEKIHDTLHHPLALDDLQGPLQVQVLSLLQHGLLIQVEDVGPSFAEFQHDDVRLGGLYDPPDVLTALLGEMRSANQVDLGPGPGRGEDLAGGGQGGISNSLSLGLKSWNNISTDQRNKILVATQQLRTIQCQIVLHVSNIPGTQVFLLHLPLLGTGGLGEISCSQKKIIKYLMKIIGGLELG